MAKFICLLRGINVGSKVLKMEDLRKLFESLGFKDVTTYIQSGNVLFNAPASLEESLRKKIEAAIKKKFSMDVTAILRSPAELTAVVAKNPLAQRDLSRIYVTFLDEACKKPPLEDISKAKAKMDELVIQGREVYFFCPEGYGKTKLSNNFLEKKLNCSGTTRNWNTVLKLAEMAK